jgi:hypothetical protein
MIYVFAILLIIFSVSDLIKLGSQNTIDLLDEQFDTIQNQFPTINKDNYSLITKCAIVLACIKSLSGLLCGIFILTL